jgi:hypothetical protein
LGFISSRLEAGKNAVNECPLSLWLLSGTIGKIGTDQHLGKRLISPKAGKPMKTSGFTQKHAFLLAGDILLFGIITLFGFASHNQLTTAGAHMFTTFVPLVAAWLMIAPHLRLFDLKSARQPEELWRPFWAMLLAAPMAGFLRGLLLQAPVLPVFILVIGGISALAMLLWRGIFAFWLGKNDLQHG